MMYDDGKKYIIVVFRATYNRSAVLPMYRLFTMKQQQVHTICVHVFDIQFKGEVDSNTVWNRSIFIIF